MSWLILALRRLGDDRAATVGLATLVLVTALFAAGAPRLLAGLANEALRSEVAAATATNRDLQLIEQQSIVEGPQGDPLLHVREAGERLVDTVPASVRALIRDRVAVVETGRFRVQLPTTDPAFLRLRVQEGIADHVRYVEGRPPTGTVLRRDDVGIEHQDGVPVYEAAISRATAARYGIGLDAVVPLVGDPGDPLIGRTPQDFLAFVDVVGVYDVPDPAAEYWLDDPLLVRPVIRALSAEVQFLDAGVVLDEAAYGTLVDAFRADAFRPLRYIWRSYVAADRLDAAGLEALVADARRLQTSYPSANVTTAYRTALRTGLLPLLEGHARRWAAAESVTAVIALGPALVAGATLGLIAVLAARRRRTTMALARSRGGSEAQVLWPAFVEGLVVALPPAAGAWALAVALVPAGSATSSAAAAGAVVAVTVAVMIATVVPVARGLGGEARVATRPVRRPGQRRLVAEGFVVAGAVVGVVLLRDRGIRAASSAGAVAGFDPLIAAVPALVGLAAGIVAVRLYPYPVRTLAWLAARGRGLVALLAVRRAAEGAAPTAVLLVLLATASIGAFATVALDHLDRGADLAAWADVGGAYRLQSPSGPLPAALDPAALPGRDAAASWFEAATPVGLVGPRVTFVAVDAAGISAVLAGTPAEVAFPRDFDTPAPGPIPALISRGLTTDPRGVGPGDVFTMTIQGYAVECVAVEVRDAFPGLHPPGEFVMVSRDAFSGRAPEARLAPVVAVVRAPPEAAAEIRASVEAVAPAVGVTSQAELVARLRGSPVTGAVRAVILAAAVMTAAYAALGIAAALALAGLSRAAETAHLRTLGLSGRQAFALLFAEHGPTTVAAFGGGSVLGAGLFVVLRPALGIADLVGSPVDIPLSVDGPTLLAILSGVVVVVAFGLALGATIQRRLAPAAAIRGRFE